MNEQEFKDVFGEVEKVYQNYNNLSDDFKEDLNKDLDFKPNLNPKELNFYNFCIKNFNQIDECLLRLDEFIKNSNSLTQTKFAKFDKDIKQAFKTIDCFNGSLSLKERNIALLRQIIQTQNERITALENELKALKEK